MTAPFDPEAYVRWRTENGWPIEAAVSVASFVTAAEAQLARVRDTDRPKEEAELAAALLANLVLDISGRAAAVYRELIVMVPAARKDEMRRAYEDAIGATQVKPLNLVRPRRN